MRTFRVEFWWAVHNLIAHPASQFLWWGSLCGRIKPIARAGDWCHDWTVPQHAPEEGRG